MVEDKKIPILVIFLISDPYIHILVTTIFVSSANKELTTHIILAWILLKSFVPESYTNNPFTIDITEYLGTHG